MRLPGGDFEVTVKGPDNKEKPVRVVEIKGLKEPENDKAVELAGLLFVTEGVHGLHAGDPLKLEEEHEEEKK